MTINREAAELMALRLTNAVDAAHTFAEALRLATVALREPREVPEVEPGTVGTATVRCWSDRQRVVRACDDDAKESRPRWLVTDLCEGCGLGWHDDEEITDFVPDPDTAALRAEVERLNGELESERHAVETQSGLYEGLANWAKGQRARADAAEGRLARLTREALVSAIGYVGPMGNGTDGLPLDPYYAADRILALVAADEQAAEGEGRAALPTREQIAEAIKAEADRRDTVAGGAWITLAGAGYLADAVLALFTGGQS